MLARQGKRKSRGVPGAVRRGGSIAGKERIEDAVGELPRPGQIRPVGIGKQPAGPLHRLGARGLAGGPALESVRAALFAFLLHPGYVSATFKFR